MDVVIKLVMKPLPEDKRKYPRRLYPATRSHSPSQRHHVYHLSVLVPFPVPLGVLLIPLFPFIITLLITFKIIVYAASTELIYTKVMQTLTFLTKKKIYFFVQKYKKQTILVKYRLKRLLYL